MRTANRIKFLFLFLLASAFFNFAYADIECAAMDCSVNVSINVVGIMSIAFSGSVKDLYGTLITNSNVSALGTGYSTIATDGTYELNGGMPSGRYDLVASASGYLNQARTNQLTIDGTTAIIDFQLSLVSGVGGGVVDFWTGAGINNANVTLRQFGENIDSTLTNPAGFYSFTGLAPGYYDIYVSAAGYTSNSKPNNQVLGGQDSTVDLWIW